MKSEAVIKQIRTPIAEMWEQYQQQIARGERGSCLSPDRLKQLYERTDEEILQAAEENGVYIIDKDEYLEKLKKEKTL